MKQPEKILKSVFGYNYFRPLQKDIINNVLNKIDTLAIMPTGGGKSLCYQIPALIFEGITNIREDIIERAETFVFPNETEQDNSQKRLAKKLKSLPLLKRCNT